MKYYNGKSDPARDHNTGWVTGKVTCVECGRARVVIKDCHGRDDGLCRTCKRMKDEKKQSSPSDRPSRKVARANKRVAGSDPTHQEPEP